MKGSGRSLSLQEDVEVDSTWMFPESKHELMTILDIERENANIDEVRKITDRFDTSMQQTDGNFI